MAVPEEIRKVERPKNTKVLDRGGSGIKRYAVIARCGCKRVNGRNIPVEGGTIGHIINGKYVPCDFQLSQPLVEMKDYANVILIDSLSRELFDELCLFYSYTDALKIYVIAILKVCNSGLRNFMVSRAYDESWISELFPNVPLSKNTLSEFEHKIGLAYSRLVNFMRMRTEKMSKNKHIAIDGSLITDNSSVNTLSSYSRKTLKKGTKDISVIYAYDVETREPVCGKVYAGNITDQTAYRDFLIENNITKGIIIGDKAFARGEVADIFDKNKELGWLYPLKRNDKRIGKYNLMVYDGRLNINDKDVLFKKICVNGYWLYAFRNRAIAAKEEEDYYRHNNPDEFDMDNLMGKVGKFGTLVLESNSDLAPEIIYKMFSERWIIEEYFKMYKNFLEFDQTNVHSTASVIGSQLINFIASVMTSKVMNKVEQIGLLDKHTFGEIMTILDRAKKVKVGSDGQWRYMRLTKYAYIILVQLNLANIEDATPEFLMENPKLVKRKPGRPRKYPV